MQIKFSPEGQRNHTQCLALLQAIQKQKRQAALEECYRFWRKNNPK